MVKIIELWQTSEEHTFFTKYIFYYDVFFIAGKRLNDKNKDNYVKTQRKLGEDILDIIQNLKNRTALAAILSLQCHCTCEITFADMPSLKFR